MIHATRGHVFSRLYTVRPREGEWVYFWTIQLDFKGITTFAEIRRANCVQCWSFIEACKARGPFADDSERVPAVADAFRSSFLPYTHVFVAFLANCKLSSPRSLRNEHLDTFIIDIGNSF